MIRYRFHGRFTSASNAARLGNLRGAREHVRTEVVREGRIFARKGYTADRDFKRQLDDQFKRSRASAAAKLGWETRRREAAKRSEAARKGWETRRARFPTVPERMYKAAPEAEAPAAVEYYEPALEEMEVPVWMSEILDPVYGGWSYEEDMASLEDEEYPFQM